MKLINFWQLLEESWLSSGLFWKSSPMESRLTVHEDFRNVNAVSRWIYEYSQKINLPLGDQLKLIGILKVWASLEHAQARNLVDSDQPRMHVQKLVTWPLLLFFLNLRSPRDFTVCFKIPDPSFINLQYISCYLLVSFIHIIAS